MMSQTHPSSPGDQMMRFSEQSLFLGVDSLRLFEYLSHFRDPHKAMVDIATYVAVNQDIRVALGLAENLVVAKFLSYDPKDDYEREVMEEYWPRLRRPFYLTRACHEFLRTPYLRARSENLKGPHWSIDESFDEQPLPTFEKIEIDHPFKVTSARWLHGTIQTNTYMKGRIAPGLIHPSEHDRDRYLQLHRVNVLVHDPDAGRSWYVDDEDPLDEADGAETGRAEVGEEASRGGTETSRYDGAVLFAISYRGSFLGDDLLIEVGRSFEAEDSVWRLDVEVTCASDASDLQSSDHTLLQSTLTAVIGADLVRLAYLAGEAERAASIECSIRFASGSLGGLRESMQKLTGVESFWAPIPSKLRNLIRVSVT